jgi:hypothetical protein
LTEVKAHADGLSRLFAGRRHWWAGRQDGQGGNEHQAMSLLLFLAALDTIAAVAA